MGLRNATISFCLLAASAVAETKVLQNFTLIDGTGRAAVASAAVVITDGRVTYAGPASKMKAPANSETIDLAGKFVMPGIINLHGHLGNTVGLAQDPKNFTTENLAKNLATYASYGVTSMISMGTDQEPMYAVRSEQRSGRPKTTRIFSAGRGFTGKAGYPTSAPGMKGVPYEVETAGQAKEAVDANAAKKVDIIKIWVDDHLGKERKIPMDLSKAIIDNAHRHRLKVAAHIFYLDDAKKLVSAGLDGLAHSVRDAAVDEELIGIMKRRGAWLAAATLTREVSAFIYATPPDWLKDPFFTRSISPETQKGLSSPEFVKKAAADPDFAKLPGFLEMAKKNLKRLADAGVKYGFGTDTGPPGRFPGYFEHMEMELMVQGGLTPMQVIVAASKSGAEFLGESKNLGTIEKGHWADLVVLGRNPLDDIKNTRTIEQVYIAGNRI